MFKNKSTIFSTFDAKKNNILAVSTNLKISAFDMYYFPIKYVLHGFSAIFEALLISYGVKYCKTCRKSA